MTTRSTFTVRSVAILAPYLGFFVALAALSERATAQATSPAQSEMKKLSETKGAFSVTVLPPAVPKYPVGLPTRVLYAKGVAMMLERAGVKTIEVSEHNFDPKSAKCDDLDSLARAVPECLKRHPVETDYVYAAVFCGTPDTGATAILTVVADRNGQIIWRRLQNAEDEDFQRVAPKDPLASSYVSVEPFRKALGLVDPTGKDAKSGPWGAYFDQRQRKESESDE